ncbi:MAG: DinB family protein [Gemmatimonadaceae bacterium]|nr:DinB family protein [Gemmatimonadaceae bacterium]
MSIAQSILPEFDHEMATTRKLLERAPEAQFGWKPHEKSMSLGQLANHLAALPFWGVVTMKEVELDMNPPGGEGYKTPRLATVAEILAAFDDNVGKARAAIASSGDADFMVAWSLKNAGHTIFTMPRIAVLRTFVINHEIHHRGQFSVYLRLHNVPVPSIYGPTADES